MTSKRSRSEEKVIELLREVKNDAERYNKNSELAKLIEKFIEKYEQSKNKCTEDYVSKLRKDLKDLPGFAEKFEIIVELFLRNEENKKLYERFISITDELARYSDERLLSSDEFREWFKKEINVLYEVCHKIIKLLLEEAQKVGPREWPNIFNAKFNEWKKRNEWFRGCLENKFNEIFNKLYECMIYNELKFNLELLKTSDNILDLLQSALGLPVNIIHHRPIKYVHYTIGDNRDSAPLTEIFYSLSPFIPLRVWQGGEYAYYVFVPKGEYVSYRVIPEAEIAELQEIVFVKVGNELVNYGRRFKINADALAGNSPFYACKLGFGPIAITDNKCTFDKCNIRNRCFNSYTNEYRYLIKLEDLLRVYHVYPNIKKDIKLIEQNALLLKVLLEGSSLKPLVKVGIDSAYAVIKLDSMIFSPREKYQHLFIRTPELKIRLWPKGAERNIKNKELMIGILLTNSNALTLRFPKNTLYGIIMNLLQNDEVLRRYIYIKMRAYKALGKDEREEVLNSVNYIEEELSKSNYKKDGILVDNDLIEYSIRVFAHTLGHVLLTYLSAQLQIEPLTLLDYYYEINNDYVIVTVYELGEGGLGLLERNTLVSIFNKDILTEILNYIRRIDGECDRRINQSKSIFSKQSQKVGITIIKSDDLKKLWRKYVDNPYTKITVNAQILRYKAHELIEKEMATRDEVEEFLSNVPICMDGCVYCVLLERGCGEPLAQQYTTSRRLLLRVLEKISELGEENYKKLDKALDEVGEVRETLFMGFLGLASSELKLMTYIIDDYVADKLIKLKQDKQNLKIRLLIDSEKVDELKKDNIIDKLRNAGIEVRALSDLHSKVYIVDDALVLEGSMNLTRKGLRENRENLTLVYALNAVNKRVHQFEDSWRKANEVG